MNPRARVAPVGAHCHSHRNVEAGDDLAADAELQPVANAATHQCVLRKPQRVAAGHADVIGEFHRCRAGAAFLAVDDDEVGIDPGCQHCLADAEKLPFVADAEFESGGLAAAQFAQARDEFEQALR